ncbi:MAG: phosphopentomutase [Thermodesulfobacteriota bacterium]
MKKTGLTRAVIVVFDALGIGELPDAGDYGDRGSDTLDNISRAVGGLHLPNLSRLGLGLIEGVDRIERADRPAGSYGRMSEASPGKDTATGHWEMAGVVLAHPFPTFPEGFPPEIMERFAEIAGRGWLGNYPASGTEIIEKLGPEHMRTGRPIVYTSADSVFQIAAHEDVIPTEELYRICRDTRELLYEYNVGRVIARPFVGEPGSFTRTTRRRDFSVEPPDETLLDRVKARGMPVVAVGKIGDIFVHRGTTEEIHTKSDSDGIDRTVEAMKRVTEGLIFTNLVDLDTLFAHRNNPEGSARALEEADGRLPEITALVKDGDMLIITGDHGCDPTTPSTDHSREYVPLLVYGSRLKGGVALGTRATFADLGATVAEALGVGPLGPGESFLGELLPRGGEGS